MRLAPSATKVPWIQLAMSLLVLLFSGTSNASPRREASQEAALEDGVLDVDDVALRGPFTTLASATPGRTVLGGPSGSTWLSLVGFTRRTVDDRREVGGFVLLGLPLERFARTSTRERTAPGPVEARPPPDEGILPELLRTSAPPPSGAPSLSEPPFELALTPRLARACVTAAWRAAGLSADDSRLDALASRARWSAALPEARLRAVRFEDARLSLDTGTETSRFRDSAGANVGFEARLTWRFDRLLYADDEPAFERLRLEHRDARGRVAARVLEALFHWQRAMLDLRTLPPSQQGTRDEADVSLRVMEAEAALDVLTNGWFAAQERRGLAPPRATSTAGGQLRSSTGSPRTHRSASAAGDL